VSSEGVPPPHPGLSRAAATEAGREWLQRLPRLVEECQEKWSLLLGEPFAYAYASLAVPATLPGGGEAVLKICLPDRESEYEAEALVHWNGRGAVLSSLTIRSAGRSCSNAAVLGALFANSLPTQRLT
jgi:hypothetical protein